MLKYILKADQYRKLSQSLRYQAHLVDIGGLKIETVDAHSFLFMLEEIFVNNSYAFKAQNNSPYIIDCGSNIGLSIIYFKLLYPESTIIGFEPDPKIFDVLNKNININNFKNVTLYQKALSNNDGIISFHVEGSWGGSTIKYREMKSIEVQSTILSKFITKKVDLLKIDIEGGESIVLNEIQNKLDLVENLIIEFHTFPRHDQNLSKLLRILEDNYFRYHIKESYPRKRVLTEWIYNGMDSQIEIYAKKIRHT